MLTLLSLYPPPPPPPGTLAVRPITSTISFSEAPVFSAMLVPEAAVY